MKIVNFKAEELARALDEADRNETAAVRDTDGLMRFVWLDDDEDIVWFHTPEKGVCE